MHVPYLKQLPGWSGKTQKFGLFLVGSSPLLDRDFELNWIKGVLSPNQTLPQTAKTVWGFKYSDNHISPYSLRLRQTHSFNVVI
jgi:hypothetical protein